MQLVSHRRGAEGLEARLRELVDVAADLRVETEAREGDLVALRHELAPGGSDRVVVDQAVDLLRNLRRMRRRAGWLLDALHRIKSAGLIEESLGLTGPAAALAMALSAAEHALVPLAAADGQSNVALIGGVSTGMAGRFVPIADGSAREVLELLSLALGAAIPQPGMGQPRRLRAVTSMPTTTAADAS